MVIKKENSDVEIEVKTNPFENLKKMRGYDILTFGKTEVKISQLSIAEYPEFMEDNTIFRETEEIDFEDLFQQLLIGNAIGNENFSKTISNMQKWIDKKITFNGNKATFTEMEEKYSLTKNEIMRIYIHFCDISGFHKQ